MCFVEPIEWSDTAIKAVPWLSGVDQEVWHPNG